MQRIVDMKIPFLNSVMWEWHTRHNPGCERALMTRYWKMLLVICGLVLASAIAFALWSISSPWEPATNEPPISQDNPDTLRREQIRSVIDLYDARKTQFDHVKVTPPRVADPS